MLYIIAGKFETFKKYLVLTDNDNCKNVVYAHTLKEFNKITEDDTIVLLAGWWAKEWAKDAIKNIVVKFPEIKFNCEDGVFGKEVRKSLESDNIKSRFDILDL